MLDGVDSQRHAPVALPPGRKETPVHIELEVWWAPWPVSKDAENIAPVQPSP